MRARWTSLLILVGYLASAKLADADSTAPAIYTFNDPLQGIHWSFEFPSLVTTTDTINITTSTDRLSASIDPSSPDSSLGCTIEEAGIGSPTTTNPIVVTLFSGCTNGSGAFGRGFDTPIDRFGTFTVLTEQGPEITLTVSPATLAVPEPCMLFLLGAGWIGVVGVTRRKECVEDAKR